MLVNLVRKHATQVYRIGRRVATESRARIVGKKCYRPRDEGQFVTRCDATTIDLAQRQDVPARCSGSGGMRTVRKRILETLYLMSQIAFGRVACTARAAGRGNTQPFQTLSEP